MPRGLLTSPNETPPSKDELSFYLPRLITTYTDIEKRGRRRLALFATFSFSACVIAYAADADSAITLPLIGVKLSPFIATAALYAMGIVLGTLSTFDRAAAKAFRQEVEVIHKLRYGTESPFGI